MWLSGGEVKIVVGFDGASERKTSLEVHRRGWKLNIKMGLGEIRWSSMDRISVG